MPWPSWLTGVSRVDDQPATPAPEGAQRRDPKRDLRAAEARIETGATTEALPLIEPYLASNDTRVRRRAIRLALQVHGQLHDAAAAESGLLRLSELAKGTELLPYIQGEIAVVQSLQGKLPEAAASFRASAEGLLKADPSHPAAPAVVLRRAEALLRSAGKDADADVVAAVVPPCDPASYELMADMLEPYLDGRRRMTQIVDE